MDDQHPEAVRFECGDTTYVLKVGMAAFQLAKFRHGIDVKLSDLDRVGAAFAGGEDAEPGAEEAAGLEAADLEATALEAVDLETFDEAMGLVYKIGWAGVLPSNPDLSYGDFLAEVALAGADQALALATMKAISRMNDALTDEEKEKLEERLERNAGGKEGNGVEGKEARGASAS